MAPRNKPLHGRTVVVTAPYPAGERLSASLEDAGAKVLAAPMIRFVGPADPDALKRAATRPFDWIAFLSPRAAKAWVELGPANCVAEVAAVGRVTESVLLEAGIEPALVAPNGTAVSLAEAILDTVQNPARLRVLLLQGDKGRPDFGKALREAGASVDTALAYQTLEPTEADYEAVETRLAGRPCDALVFTSPSTFNHFRKRDSLRALLRTTAIFAIGPTTAAEIENDALCCHVAEPHNYEGLLRAVCAHFEAD